MRPAPPPFANDVEEIYRKRPEQKYQSRPGVVSEVGKKKARRCEAVSRYGANTRARGPRRLPSELNNARKRDGPASQTRHRTAPYIFCADGEVPDRLIGSDGASSRSIRITGRQREQEKSPVSPSSAPSLYSYSLRYVTRMQCQSFALFASRSIFPVRLNGGSLDYLPTLQMLPGRGI